MDDGIINTYIQSLDTSTRPHILIGEIYSSIFNRKMESRDYAQVGRLVKVYGRWRVLDALLRSSGVEINDEKGIWPYVNVVCASLVKEEQEASTSVFNAIKEREKTQKLIDSLKKRPEPFELRNKAWLTYNNV